MRIAILAAATWLLLACDTYRVGYLGTQISRDAGTQRQDAGPRDEEDEEEDEPTDNDFFDVAKR
jgi:hypothetical protein